MQESQPATGVLRNPPPKRAAVADNVTDKWLGKWIGPEGTYLVLSKNAEKYVVEINSLDGPATYDGTSAGDRIEFQRNGKQSTFTPAMAMTPA